MVYGLTMDERKEFEELKQKLFKGQMLVEFDEDHDQEDVYRYNYLMKKKQELILATVN
ncbi:MAG: hypothetical protein AABY15_06900 [Nanoarchaeota archaeon]